VLATHFDDYTGPPTDEPPSPGLVQFEAEIRACAPHTRLIVPKHFARMTL